MKILKQSERVVAPEDSALVDRRLEELETACRGILMKLTPEERAFFREYAELLQRREDMYIQTAFQSGVRVGQRREGK